MKTAAEQQNLLKQAATWFVELQSEQCTDLLRQQFEDWLTENPTHSQAYFEIEQLWGDIDTLKGRDVPGLNDARAAGRRSWRKTSALFSALLACGLLGGAWWQHASAPQETYQTGIGERRTVVLGDGSSIQLNTATRLSVRMSWLRREVELQQGEALFDVAHRNWQPFGVAVGGIRISDIGTVFNVRRSAAGTAVAVLEGEVELRKESSWIGQNLRAGFSRQIDANGRWLPIQPATRERSLAWTDGQLWFDHTPLADVTAELERYHPVHFVLAAPELARQTVSGRFDADDLKPFLLALEKILPVRVQQQKQTIVLHPR
ncbi:MULTISPECIES: FecR family protein [Methylomonas]|uniref:Iron dicitrate transport regulator FecR n=1 Tax=Methylomonas koyamae TaxID=702114 RepID=A0A177N1L7_9GAMM|nr:FecR family protein [Methylomonas koyamae]OAI11867.1 hypothetical protein A1355_15345 [Methylomonas koyamae]